MRGWWLNPQISWHAIWNRLLAKKKGAAFSIFSSPLKFSFWDKVLLVVFLYWRFSKFFFRICSADTRIPGCLAKLLLLLNLFGFLFGSVALPCCKTKPTAPRSCARLASVVALPPKDSEAQSRSFAESEVCWPPSQHYAKHRLLMGERNATEMQVTSGGGRFTLLFRICSADTRSPGCWAKCCFFWIFSDFRKL